MLKITQPECSLSTLFFGPCLPCPMRFKFDYYFDIL